MTLRAWLVQNGYARYVDELEARERLHRENEKMAKKTSERLAAKIWAERYAAAVRRMGLDVALQAALRGPSR